MQTIAVSAAAASAAGIITFLSKYPRTPRVTGGRYSVGSCLTRLDGCPACQIFYPAEASACSGPTSGTFFRPKLIENIASNYLKGWIPAAMLKFLSCRGLYHQNAPVETGHGRFPVIIFSHGLFGTLDMYKTLCGGLAASGFIVVALEHEDGTALYSVDQAGQAVKYRGPPKDFQYGRDNVVEFRKPYIAKRVGEIQKTVKAMSEKAPGLGNAAVVARILERADTQELFLAGHSFGSAACIVASESMPGIKGCLLTDLWAVPVPRSIEENGLQNCPALFVNSQTFAKGIDIRIPRRVAANSSAAIGPVWIAGTVHQSFSDTPCVMPSFVGNKIGMCGKSDVDQVHQTMLDAGRAFFQHCREASDVKDKAQLQLLEDSILADPLMSNLFDDILKPKSSL